MSRSQQIGERARLQLRTEFFNAFNTTQLAGPQGSLTAADFGKITSAGSPRNIQFGLRRSFRDAFSKRCAPAGSAAGVQFHATRNAAGPPAGH